MHSNLILKNVAYIPSAPRNIISLARLLAGGYTAQFSKTNYSISLGKKVILNFEMKNKLFPINMSNFVSENLFNIDEEIDTDEEANMEYMDEDKSEWYQAHVS